MALRPMNDCESSEVAAVSLLGMKRKIMEETINTKIVASKNSNVENTSEFITGSDNGKVLKKRARVNNQENIVRESP